MVREGAFARLWLRTGEKKETRVVQVVDRERLGAEPSKSARSAGAGCCF